jgi:hypothetical protein
VVHFQIFTASDDAGSQLWLSVLVYADRLGPALRNLELGVAGCPLACNESAAIADMTTALEQPPDPPTIALCLCNINSDSDADSDSDPDSESDALAQLQLPVVTTHLWLSSSVRSDFLMSTGLPALMQLQSLSPVGKFCRHGGELQLPPHLTHLSITNDPEARTALIAAALQLTSSLRALTVCTRTNCPPTSLPCLSELEQLELHGAWPGDGADPMLFPATSLHPAAIGRLQSLVLVCRQHVWHRMMHMLPDAHAAWHV